MLGNRLDHQVGVAHALAKAGGWVNPIQDLVHVDGHNALRPKTPVQFLSAGARRALKCLPRSVNELDVVAVRRAVKADQSARESSADHADGARWPCFRVHSYPSPVQSPDGSTALIHATRLC